MRNIRMKEHEKHTDSENEFNVSNYDELDVYLDIYMYH